MLLVSLRGGKNYKEKKITKIAKHVMTAYSRKGSVYCIIFWEDMRIFEQHCPTCGLCNIAAFGDKSVLHSMLLS